MSLNFTTHSRDVEWYNDKYDSDRYSLSRWQRDDCWPPKYKKYLILSIIRGIDIPKIYIGQIINTNIETIIDGGHRTRAINDFIKNNFSIKINEKNVFFDKQIDQATRNTRNLTNEEKRRFLTFNLTVTTYTNITENNCRMIFNILQNAQPMSIADVINSYQSNLIDYLRDISNNFIINGIPLNELVIQNKILPKTENSELLYQLASWFTIVNPILNENDDVEEDVSMKYLEKGKTRESKCLEYIKKHDMLNIPITDEIKRYFEEKIIYLINYPDVKKMHSADINTLLHSKCWINGFSEIKFTEFLNSLNEYSTLKNKSNKEFKNGNIDNGRDHLNSANMMDENSHGNLSEWKNSKTSGGSNFTGMNRRKEIVKLCCCE